MKQKRKTRTWRTPVNKIVHGILKGKYSVRFARTYAGFLLHAVALIDSKVGKAKEREPQINLRLEAKSAKQRLLVAFKEANPDMTTREIAKACGVSAATVSRYTREV